MLRAGSMIRTELVRVVKQSVFCGMRKLNESCNILTEDILICCDSLTAVQPVQLFFIMNTILLS